MEIDPQSERVIRREEEKLERKKAKVEALKENLKKTLNALIKDKEVQRAVGGDIIRATSNSNPHNEKFKKAQQGIYMDDELVTGHEPRVWERN